jgi:hypothetical protein
MDPEDNRTAALRYVTVAQRNIAEDLQLQLKNHSNKICKVRTVIYR